MTPTVSIFVRDDVVQGATAQVNPCEQIDLIEREMHMAVTKERIDTARVEAVGGDVVRQELPGGNAVVAVRQPSTAVDAQVVRPTNVVVHRVPRGSVDP